MHDSSADSCNAYPIRLAIISHGASSFPRVEFITIRILILITITIISVIIIVKDGGMLSPFDWP